MEPEVTRRGFLGKAGSAAAVAGVGAALTAGPVQAAEDKKIDKKIEDKKIKVLAICCSPRQGKSTATVLKACLEAAQAVSPNIETELIELGGLKIPGEVAAGVKLAEGEKDDFPAFAPKLTEPHVAATSGRAQCKAATSGRAQCKVALFHQKRIRPRRAATANVVALNIVPRVFPIRLVKDIRAPLPFAPHGAGVARFAVPATWPCCRCRGRGTEGVDANGWAR
jgi:hypothetical protein